MSSCINVKNYGYTPHPEAFISESMADLTRESSIHVQNTLGGSGKDFGSMNMDEFLKNIWTSEETQTIALNSDLGVADNVNLPTTLNRKTLDDVRRELHTENGGFKDVNLIREQPQEKQPAMGEMTLEEFLRKAGVVSQNGRPRTNQRRFGDENCFLYKGFHQEPVVADGKTEVKNLQGVRISQQPKPQKILPKQTAFDVTSSLHLAKKAQTGSGLSGVSIHGNIENPTGLVTEAQLGNGVSIIKNSNLSPSDLFPNSNLDTSPSPPHYVYGASEVCGRNMGGSLEKVVERRRKRMIKNRESAARSRARKQAYTLELEAEVAKLKQINHELQKKQEEIMESHNFQVCDQNDLFQVILGLQVPEKMKLSGNGKPCLRRTLTGPW